jgi:hypothetical protein
VIESHHGSVTAQTLSRDMRYAVVLSPILHKPMIFWDNLYNEDGYNCLTGPVDPFVYKAMYSLTSGIVYDVLQLDYLV